MISSVKKVLVRTSAGRSSIDRRSSGIWSGTGFTLIELIISTAIFCMLVLMIFSLAGSFRNIAALTNSLFIARSDQERALYQITAPIREDLIAIHSVNGEMHLADGWRIKDLLVYHVDLDHDGNRDLDGLGNPILKGVGLRQQDMDGDGQQDFLDANQNGVQDIEWEEADWTDGNGDPIFWNKEPFLFEMVTGDVRTDSVTFWMDNLQSWCRNIRSDGNSDEDGSPEGNEVTTYGLFEYESDNFDDGLDSNSDGIIQEFEIGDWNNGNGKIDNLLISGPSGMKEVADNPDDTQDQYSSAIIEVGAINSIIVRFRIARFIRSQKRWTNIITTLQIFPRNWERE
ncbi:type II secretion system protein J [Candidatus Omnitrophota bacterium]